MKKDLIKIKGITVILLTGLAACNTKPMSFISRDKTKGLNGSFEHSRDGIPVNWQLYTAQTVPSGDFDILLDDKDARDGKQSLKFVVRSCDTTGGRCSPGIAGELPAQPGTTYKISFWVKNDGSNFQVRAGGISAMKGFSEIIVRSEEQIAEWKQYQYCYTLPEKMTALRFELNVLRPGTFLIDDIRIEE